MTCSSLTRMLLIALMFLPALSFANGPAHWTDKYDVCYWGTMSWKKQHDPKNFPEVAVVACTTEGETAVRCMGTVKCFKNNSSWPAMSGAVCDLKKQGCAYWNEHARECAKQGASVEFLTDAAYKEYKENKSRETSQLSGFGFEGFALREPWHPEEVHDLSSPESLE